MRIDRFTCVALGLAMTLAVPACRSKASDAADPSKGTESSRTPVQSGHAELKGAAVVGSGPSHVSDDIRGVDISKSRLHMDIRQ